MRFSFGVDFLPSWGGYSIPYVFGVRIVSAQTAPHFLAARSDADRSDTKERQIFH
jgi:hypothetical protein